MFSQEICPSAKKMQKLLLDKFIFGINPASARFKGNELFSCDTGHGEVAEGESWMIVNCNDSNRTVSVIHSQDFLWNNPMTGLFGKGRRMMRSSIVFPVYNHTFRNQGRLKERSGAGLTVSSPCTHSAGCDSLSVSTSAPVFSCLCFN